MPPEASVPGTDLSEPSPYLTLKLAHGLFSKTPAELGSDEKDRLRSVAARLQLIEQRIFATADAACVALPEASVDQGYAEIRQRYDSDEAFNADLERLDLSEADLREALRRELQVEAILDQVASRVAPPSETEVEIFYLMHRDRFNAPERRRLRHILITLNEELPGNTRGEVMARLEAVRARCLKAPERFAEQALKHSECPTAMNGGLLGEISRGQLYSELEPAAFALAANELSAIVESPIGLHLLRCDEVLAAGPLPLPLLRERITEQLTESRRAAKRKAWIRELLGDEARDKGTQRAAG
ncbi:nitrogen fixation protein NifM [Rhodocyclus tenuis]|uniref:peptidylprolyl isomerase n=1 Tax=Rhodocyclus tenuis TaxID=1066 RepID=A0A840GIN1_RHOTE|nr:nitrogen fixation protein NifM [Rhodocyclus tenuis]MBB4248039.1 peptidylprolyl isomerase/peptidyl-prolyl cis-trans isomerase C [Rhodocyclus tenuis]MBK1679472.1 nitrogen fixation protein NifM [Rhodocyclus tenuis]